MNKLASTLVAVGAASTPWGWFGLGASSRGLTACNWPWADEPEARQRISEAILKRAGFEIVTDSHVELNSYIEQAAEALLAFFAGSPARLDKMPLDLSLHTDWQQKVLLFVRAVPFGKTISYGEAAARCGSPRGARAVGTAMAGNQLPIFIPCHRVIYGDGKTGNYSGGGPELKKSLLLFEKERRGW